MTPPVAASLASAEFEAVMEVLNAGDLDRAGIALAQMPVMTLTNRPDRQAEPRLLWPPAPHRLRAGNG